MENKSSKGIIIILILIIIGLIGFIVYDNLNDNKKENSKEIVKVEEKETEKEEQNNKTYTFDEVSGVYKFTNENNETYELHLNSDGTFLDRQYYSTPTDYMGTYTINENKIILSYFCKSNGIYFETNLESKEVKIDGNTILYEDLKLEKTTEQTENVKEKIENLVREGLGE